MGPESIKQLVEQNQGVSSIEVSDKNIKAFERVARKYGIDFALKKVRANDKTKYMVFFKARDADALNAAFEEFSAKTDKTKERPSVLEQLRVFSERVLPRDPSKERRKEHGAR